MKAAAALTQSSLLRVLKSQPQPSFHRHICAPPEKPPLPSEDQSFVTQVANLLESDDSDWSTNNTLHQLLFPSSGDSFHTLSPLSLLRIARRLGTTDKALKFFNYIRRVSPSPPPIESLSATFQAVFEFASHEEPDAITKLSDFYSMSKDFNVPLSPNSVILLLRFFARATLVDKSLHVYNSLDPDERNTHIRNVAIDVMFRSGRLDVGLQLLDEMLEPEGAHLPNKNTADIVFVALLNKNRSQRVRNEEIFVLVLKFYKRHVFPDAKWLSRFITKLCSDGNSNQALYLLHKLMDLGADVDISLWNALLIGLGKEDDFEKMIVIHNEMREKNTAPNILTVEILISCMCKFQRVDAALEVFKAVTERDSGIYVKPNVILYNTLINGLCEVGRQDEGLALMRQMHSQHKCIPNSGTYNCLIDGFCKSGEVEKSYELFIEMNELRIIPSVATLNSLVKGMCSNGRVNIAMDLFTQLQAKNLKGNAVTYTALICAFCNTNNIDKATRLFFEMLKSGCSPDGIVYYTLISGLCKAGKLEDATSVTSMMKKAGFRLDLACYNTLISAFCKENRMDKTFELLKDMDKAGVKADIITYNTVISYFGNKGDFAMAHKVMTTMIHNGYSPTIVTYGALITAYCLAGKLEEAIYIFKEMSVTQRVLPDTGIYNILINAFCKNGNVEFALSLITDMKKKEVTRTTITFNLMLKGLRDMNWIDEALKLIDQMSEEACNPDYVTMEILAEWLPEFSPNGSQQPVNTRN